eukprot:15439362-Alexandrium_andersonii.AAC.1
MPPPDREAPLQCRSMMSHAGRASLPRHTPTCIAAIAQGAAATRQHPELRRRRGDTQAEY